MRSARRLRMSITPPWGIWNWLLLRSDGGAFKVARWLSFPRSLVSEPASPLLCWVPPVCHADRSHMDFPMALRPVSNAGVFQHLTCWLVSGLWSHSHGADHSRLVTGPVQRLDELLWTSFHHRCASFIPLCQCVAMVMIQYYGGICHVINRLRLRTRQRSISHHSGLRWSTPWSSFL